MRKRKLCMADVLALALILGLVLAGCDDGTTGGGEKNDNAADGGSTTYTFTFSNTSSLSVHITSADLNPSEFYVGTGSTKTATSSKSNIFVAYDTGGAGDVACDINRSTHTYTFSNK